MQIEGKIGVFDSGIGGVTVLKELIKILPCKNYIYYSDSIHNPYGDKNTQELQRICDHIVSFLIQKGCTIIVIACNTASAIVSSYIRGKYPSLLVMAIEPAYKMVYDYAYEKPTLVMATKGTIQSEKFKLLYHTFDNHKTEVLPCVGLADRIEQGDKESIKSYLKDLLTAYSGKVQNVVLGCTHYPLVQREIEEVLGPVTFFDGAQRLAIYLKKILEERNLTGNGECEIEFFDSSQEERKKEIFFEYLKEGKNGK